MVAMNQWELYTLHGWAVSCGFMVLIKLCHVFMQRQLGLGNHFVANIVKLLRVKVLKAIGLFNPECEAYDLQWEVLKFSGMVTHMRLRSAPAVRNAGCPKGTNCIFAKFQSAPYQQRDAEGQK